MEIRKVKISEFRSIAKNNEYYFWSFLQRNQNEGDLTFWSLFDNKISKKHKKENKLIEFLKIFPISFYESYIDESVDFLLDLGISSELIYRTPNEEEAILLKKRDLYYYPCILLFKKYNMIDSTFNHCYCVEGLTKMIISKIPDFLENSKLD